MTKPYSCSCPRDWVSCFSQLCPRRTLVQKQMFEAQLEWWRIAGDPRLCVSLTKAIWDQYPVGLPAWDALPEYMGNGDIPGRAEFREMARGALEAEGIVIDD